MKKTLLLVAISGLIACAPQVAVKKETPSGRAEALFVNQTVTEVQSIIINHCIDKQQEVETSPTQVVCGKDIPYTPFTTTLIWASVGNAYSSYPKAKAKFLTVAVGKDVRVVLSEAWAESTMPNGRVNTISLINNEVRNSAQEFLDRKVAELNSKPSNEALSSKPSKSSKK